MTTTDNRTIARRVLEEIFPACDDAALAETTSPDFINHEAPPGTPPGPGSVSYYMHMLHAAFSDQAWTMHHVVAENDTVVLHCTHSGRHTGPFMGLPATGREFSYRQTHILRFADGRSAEHWAVRDDATLMRQLTAERNTDPAPTRATAPTPAALTSR